MLNDLEERWQEMKQSCSIGSRLYGEVIRVEPFGIFLDLGYSVLKGYQFSGIIDISTKDDDDSYGLSIDYSLWPRIGEKIHCKVVWYREDNKEISLAIAKL
jgi:predicted RNA-binding protein with RPS1 domain